MILASPREKTLLSCYEKQHFSNICSVLWTKIPMCRAKIHADDLF